MEFSVKSGSPEKQRSACIIVGVFEPRRLSSIAEQLDKISDGYISALLRRGELEGKVGQSLLLHHVPNVLSERILLIGCGKERELDERQYKQIIQKTINTLNETGSMEAVCFLTELHVKGRNNYWKVRQAVETAKESLYAFNQLKSNKNELRRPLRKMVFNVPTRRELTSGERAIQHGLAIAAGIKAAKDLSNMPPNICNAAYLASQARQLADSANSHITTKVIGEEQMKELGMNAYLAVGQGSQNESLMSVMEYKGSSDKHAKPIILVGKGLTFDSGGISIKSAGGMDEMKYDMCGAATVYGVMRVVSELQLPLNVIGVMAGCENMPGGRAYRPGDILTTLSGQTVEVLNTDAEGRLVLCDALTYVERFDPELVIDIATLTGACITALGNHYSGLLSNHNPLAHELLNASEQSGDRAWRLPMTDEFFEQIDSNFADLANTGGSGGGAITAACFLSRFATKYHWAHLDIAGTAWRSGKTKGATGRPVALLSQFLLNRAGSAGINNDD
ncbi:leucyl aminopeptidase [Photorhabdus laumondii subsp. laumondii]|uniref:Probable cytosol aminopeptidase n=2 Tax=Photorhabdus laumondii subsp. laumondii TaxID=141679 RepID=AMPA_PHOLL|nr:MULTISPECIES: leucyl aminopeptidase [Photorhabdus]Q7MZ27.1 RecName: Full=Probable cytosol aminopeptidase; AltName: Full=Leucine aminopeptidase; Short=LAP; AltName: Full=Leucyl aminopeptidase [Photorhabdus laumondii subsp. laumondii TTO1]AWK44012.1 leucyl aminopeptidase [Photorhabdus laumondii subsp. laumondii]AXG44691.1 cytosol aminopeptidase [Photorhabdus laumondii subsp. laumondii]AXG49327.1 cytosol aminopeptidase [Photorhabdus laumondii subsp. laumondii]KTL62787.1 aminopeptidase [Photorh